MTMQIPCPVCTTVNDDGQPDGVLIGMCRPFYWSRPGEQLEFHMIDLESYLRSADEVR